MKKQMGRKIAVGGEETEWFSVRAWVVVRALTVLPGNLSARTHFFLHLASAPRVIRYATA
jgi:hypothetical protein